LWRLRQGEVEPGLGKEADGHLELVANFADHTLTVTTTEAA
jgi:hypothetical protein